MGGTLTLWPGKKLASQYVPLAGLERMLASSLVFCTLLGPEGPGRRFRVPAGPLDLVVPGFAGCTGYRPYFENYTVDASILDTDDALFEAYWLCHKQIRALSSPGYSCDINFLRADGGCLGIWSRRRTYKSAISLGELIIEL